MPVDFSRAGVLAEVDRAAGIRIHIDAFLGGGMSILTRTDFPSKKSLNSDSLWA